MTSVYAHHGRSDVMPRRPTLAEIRDNWPATVSIAQACEAFGISTAWGYELAAAGEFPVRLITVRSRKRVITADLVRLLSETAGH